MHIYGPYISCCSTVTNASPAAACLQSIGLIPPTSVKHGRKCVRVCRGSGMVTTSDFQSGRPGSSESESGLLFYEA